MKVMLAASVLALLTACTTQPEPICDREDVTFNKWGEVVDHCVDIPFQEFINLHDGPDEVPTKPTEQEPEKEKGNPNKGKDRTKGKGNASANNQKGGNYDRTGHEDNGKGKGRDKQR